MPDPRPFWLRFREDGKASHAILREHEVTTPPVDVYDLAKALQISVHNVPEPGWEGAVNFDATDAHVWIREESPLLRRRFVLAYELGRIMLHPFGEYRDAAPGMLASEREQEATTFGLCLLMPASMISPLIYETRMNISQMAQVFGVHVNHVVKRIEGLLNAGEEF
jgi:hypothetical protein